MAGGPAPRLGGPDACLCSGSTFDTHLGVCRSLEHRLNDYQKVRNFVRKITIFHVFSIFKPPQHFYPTSKNVRVWSVGRLVTRSLTWYRFKSFPRSRLGAMTEKPPKIAKNHEGTHVQTAITFLPCVQKRCGLVCRT